MNKIETNSKSVKSARVSMKGKCNGQVGAPAKLVTWPKGPFTMETLFNRNAPEVASRGNGQCHLSLRKKVDVMLADETLIRLHNRKQVNGGVGRPKSTYILADLFDKKKHVKYGDEVSAKAKTSKTKNARKKAVKAVVPAVEVNPSESVAPASAPVADNVIQAPIEQPVQMAA